MEPTPDGRRPRRRLPWGLPAALLVLVALLAVVYAHHTAEQNVSAPTITRTTIVAGTSAVRDGRLAEENALAARPMVDLPAQAAQPQPMTTAVAGPPIDVPEPAVTTGRWIPSGFPHSPEGALGALKALDETALVAGDPQVYARAYRELSQPGAPEAGSTGLYSLLVSFRSRAGLPATGSVAELDVDYRVTHGQVKGVTADSEYAVVCVLGEFSVRYRGQFATAGVGDCQAMRWTGAEWRIASGAVAAPAPSAWPGSADAIKAGYRELS